MLLLYHKLLLIKYYKYHFHNLSFRLYADSEWPDWHNVDLYAFQRRAFRNGWKGRVLAGGMVIVLNLFLALHVIYFLGQYVRMCVCCFCGCISVDTLAHTNLFLSLIFLQEFCFVFFSCPSIMWPLFSFCLFLFSSQVSRVLCWAGGDVWKGVLKRMNADIGCFYQQVWWFLRVCLTSSFLPLLVMCSNLVLKC